MGRRFEDAPAIGALPFENGARIVQRMGQDVNLGVAPVDHMAIHPDPAITVVKSLGGHGGFLCCSEPVGILGEWSYMDCVASGHYDTKRAELCQ